MRDEPDPIPRLTFRELIHLARILSPGEASPDNLSGEEMHELRNKLQKMILLAWQEEIQKDLNG